MASGDNLRMLDKLTVALAVGRSACPEEKKMLSPISTLDITQLCHVQGWKPHLEAVANDIFTGMGVGVGANAQMHRQTLPNHVDDSNMRVAASVPLPGGGKTGSTKAC
jgi:hypothetical protein